MSTSYDKVAYPSGIFPQTQHARLAVLATMHGLTPAPPRTARVMEVGGGTSMNLIAMAAAWPEAKFVGFDLADSAIQIGKAMIAEAGLTNIELFTGDICEVAKTVEPGGFDYIIAHGVYAWVPGPVREALLALYGRALSESGLGFISYNALPGGYVRMIMRDRLLHAMEGIEAIEDRMAVAGALLKDMAEQELDDEPVEGGKPIHQALQGHARSMLERPPSVLFHDELGQNFAPQRIKDVVADAARHGMRFLSDAGRNLNLHGFLPSDLESGDDDEASLVHNLQMIDDTILRYFRQTVLVRSSARPERIVSESVTDRIAPLYVSGRLSRNEDGSFQHGNDRIDIDHPELTVALERISAAYPAALRVCDVATSFDARGGLLRLFAEWHLELRHDPPCCATAPVERPRTSALALAGIRLGDNHLLSLDHTIVEITQKELRALLTACDGTQTVEELRAVPHGIPPEEVELALYTATRLGLICI